MTVVGATSLGYGNATLEEVLAGLQAVGAECTELNGLPGRHGGETLTADRVRGVFEGSGVRVTSIGGYNDFTVAQTLDAEVERLMESVRLAHELEVGFVRAMVGDAEDDSTLEAVYPTVVEGFRRAAKQAAPLGVVLAIENHGRLANNGPWLARVVQEVDSPYVGHTLDTGNFAWAGRSPQTVAADIEAVLPRTVSVHVKDVHWTGAGEFDAFVPAGAGSIDLRGIFERLAARGYDGPVVSEYEGEGSHAEGTRESIAFLRTLTR